MGLLLNPNGRLIEEKEPRQMIGRQTYVQFRQGFLDTGTLFCKFECKRKHGFLIAQ
jgi:hypothetical protein